MQEIKIELKPAIIGKDLTIYDSFDQIKEKYHNK